MSINPYEPPQTGTLSDVMTAELVDDVKMWRKGNVLVVRRDAVFPNRCIKTNAPTTRRLKRKLVWHHPAYYLVILLNVLIYVIVALIAQQRATIYVGLTERRIRRRRWIILSAWLMIIAGLGMIIGSVGWLDPNQGPPFLLAGIILFLFGMIYGVIGSRVVVPIRMDRDYIWLKGASPEFLAELPPWPYVP